MGAPLNVLSYGENHYKPNEVYRSVHAEDHAVRRLPPLPSNRKRLHKLDILVVRVSKTGVMGNSKPCHSCLMVLSKHLPQRGYILANVYFSNEQGNIQCTKLASLLYNEEHHYSRFQKEQQILKDELTKVQENQKIIKARNRRKKLRSP